MAPPGAARRQVLAIFQRNGVSPQRVQFVPRWPRAAYLNSYRDIDLSLDTYPYTGHTTSLDSLWMGVPVVSLFGDTCVSRGGLSQLSNLGLAELASDSKDTFVEIAVQWAGARSRLAEFRGLLRPGMARCPLTDGARFTVNLEKAYRGMWQGWCEG
jgi:predicted O-linked N-acetylglucosamine transferase (SPINDLY family)